MNLELNANKIFKSNFLIFSLLTLISNLIIYILQFYFYKEKVEYFLCTEIKNYSLKILSKNFEVIYPESCDLNVYAEGVVNIFSFYNLTEFVYLDRPIFVLYIAIIYNILNITSFLSISSLTMLKLSFFIGQIFLTSLVSVYLLKIFNLVEINIGNKYILLPWLIAISPMFKWHIFESTSMTFTFLIFLVGIYVVKNNKMINLNFYFTGIGFLFLVHRSAFLILLFFILSNIISRELNKDKIKSVLYFFIPISLYYFSIDIFSSFSDHQAEEYRQFIWMLDILQGKETRVGGYFCQTPKSAIICYLKDVINLVKYLGIPSLTCFAYFSLNYKKLNKPIKKLLTSSIIFCAVINFFWLFIGWYPPIRFSYYGYGNLIIFLSLLIFLNLNSDISRILFSLGYTLYFIFLNHWNSPTVIEQNIYIHVSVFLFFLAIIFDYFVISANN